MFQNEGYGPAARSRNAMASIGSKVYIVGELSTPLGDNSNSVYILDTGKFSHHGHAKF